MAKKKKRIVRPQYVTKEQRAKLAPKKPIPRELKFGIIFCACALVVAVILFFALYDDGSLPVADGMPVREADNWIVANTGSTSSPKYFKTGEINGLAGYTLDEEGVLQSTGRTFFDYDAEDPSAALTSYYVTGINNEPSVTSESAHSNYVMMFAETMEISDLVHTQIDGRDAYYFTTLTIPEVPDETAEETEAEGTEETAEVTHQQQIICYLPTVHKTTLLACATVDLTDGREPLTEDALFALMEQVVGTVTFEVK